MAAGLASERTLRFLLDRDTQTHFPYKQMVVDKKRGYFRQFNHLSLRARWLALLMDWRTRQR